MNRDAITTSRRSLLTALGAAAGAGTLFGAIEALGLGRAPSASAGARSFQVPPESDFGLPGRSNGESVVVVGAGIAGLACAYELGKAGYDVTVVDAADRAGGRSWTVRSGTSFTDTSGAAQACTFAPDRWLNAGPARIAQHHTTLAYCRELGVAVEVFVNANIDAFVEHDGVVRRRRAVIADHDGYVSELLAKAVTSEVLDGDLTSDEQTGLLDYLRSVGVVGAQSTRGYEEPPGVDAGRLNGEPDPLADLLELGFGQRVRFEQGWHQAMPMFHPVGGMDAIVDALVDAIGSQRVRLGSPASALETASRGVRVVIEGDEVIDADWGVCCLQPGLAAALENPWEASVNRALRSPVGVATGKIGLEYDRRFWEQDDRILGGTSTTHPDVRVLWYPSTGYLSKGGVIVGAYPFGSAGARFDRASHAERQAMAVARGEAIHGPAYGSELVSSFSVGWNSVPHIQAAWTNWPSYGADYRLLQEPAGRWVFAGDWLSHTPGWQHGAFDSARHAVTVLHGLALAG